MKLLVYGILIGTFLIGCGQYASETERTSVSEETIVGIMIDLTLAEASVAKQPVEKRDSVRSAYADQMEYIYGKSMRQIDSILQEVFEDPIRNSELQKRVVDSIRTLESSSRAAQ